MIALVEAKRDEIAQLCVRHHVQRLELFGSATQANFDPHRSDIDLLVTFQPMSPTEHADCYFGLLESLGALFDCKVDLIEAPTLGNPYFLASIKPTRELLYAA